MKRWLIALILVGALLSAHSGSASAHVLAENNGVSSVLHIPPFDAPQAGDTTTLEFQFGADSGQFHLSDYNLNLSVLDGTQQVLKKVVGPEFFGASDQGSATLDFPEAAVYTLRLTGTAIAAGVPNFTVNYNVRVVAAPGTGTAMAHKSSGTQAALISGAVIVLFGMVAVRQIISGKRYSSGTVKVKEQKEKKHV